MNNYRCKLVLKVYEKQIRSKVSVQILKALNKMCIKIACA